MGHDKFKQLREHITSILTEDNPAVDNSLDNTTNAPLENVEPTNNVKPKF